MKLGHLLNFEVPVEIDLSNYRVNELKKITKFWVGADAAKLRKEELAKELAQVFKSPSAMRNVLEKLSPIELKVLGIYSRIGPTVPGYLLSAELHARKMVEEESKESPTSRLYRFYGAKRNDITTKLTDKLLLVPPQYHSQLYGFSSFYTQYLTLTLHPHLRDVVPPIGPLAWTSSESTSHTLPTNVTTAGVRSSAEVALDLWQVAEALKQMGKWATLKDGSLSKSSKSKLGKLAGLPSAEDDPLVPPDYQSLCYELLNEMGVLELEKGQVHIKKLDKTFQQHAALQAQQWVRGWLNFEIWQDGLGQMPNRDNEYEPVRINPFGLTQARVLLVWALCRVSHASHDWHDLETFLCDFYQATRHSGMELYWEGYSWIMPFERSQGKHNLAGEERKLAYWLESQGQWVANAIWVTLWTLGVIERGYSTGKNARPCFRLTSLGKGGFGAPEIEISAQHQQQACLTVQPNNEVVVYLGYADARQICRLASFANRTSTSGPVQTFQLARETIYRGLESGLTVEDIQSFLTDNSRTPVPNIVARHVLEWAGKRESLTLRTGICLALAPQHSDIPKLINSRQVSEGVVLLPALTPEKAKQNFEGWQIYDHPRSLAHGWTINELGELKTKSHDSISQARLALIAESRNSHWQITEQSITKAKSHGISTDQILGWLAAHLTHPLPPLMETAIRNWTGRSTAFLGQVHLLQVTREQARDALLTSPAFKPLIAGHIPPDLFLIDKSQLAEVKRLLKQIGYSLTDSLTNY